jgi:hypothetical protein
MIPHGRGTQSPAVDTTACAERRTHDGRCVAQDAVARLTGENLVFMMRLRRAESEAAALRAERDDLRMAVEQHQGPWFEEVHQRDRECNLGNWPLCVHIDAMIGYVIGCGA